MDATTTSCKTTNKVLDDAGKAVFDNIYDMPDPRHYFQVMASLDYSIPEQAKPVFRDLFERYRQHTGQKTLRILDLGSSYGINAALLKWDLSLQQLFDHYADAKHNELSSSALQARDKVFFNDGVHHSGLGFIGFDISKSALDYATKAGILDLAVRANLEENNPTPEQEAVIASANCVISSGCIGYISEKTLLKIIDVCAPRNPWMAHCILRMFSIKPIEDLLLSRGYRVSRHPQLVRQRRFASEEEQETVVRSLHEQGIDTQGFESEGWQYATVITAIQI